MRRLRMILLVSLLTIGLAACGSDDSGNDASDATTPPPASDTTLGSTSTTKAANAGVSPCLTKDEVAALAGQAPDTVEERPHAGKGWPNGGCRYRWSAPAEWDVNLETRGDTAKYYADSVARAKSNQYQEEIPCSGVGEACYTNRSTNNRSVVGLIGLLYARDGDWWVGSSYSDAQLKLKPTIEETAKLLRDLVAAQLTKAKAA